LLSLPVLQVDNAIHIVSKKSKNKELLNVVVENYAAEGKCIARVDNKVIFIEGVVPGDVVDIYLKKNKKDWADAGVKNMVQKSKNRVDAFCGHFTICGGCKWQMLPYPLQLQYKQQQVQDVLQRIGKVQDAIYLPIKGSAMESHYRNKLEFTFSNKKYLTAAELNTTASADSNVVGFHAPRLFDKVIDIAECHLMQEPQNKIRNGIREFALANQFTFYDIKNNHGLLRNMMIRTANTGQTLVNMMFGENNEDAIAKTMDYLEKSFPEITSLHYTINTKGNDTIYDLEVCNVKGPGFIIEKLEDFQFKISPKSFFQTNTAQAEMLYQITREFAAFTGSDVLYDLYCGTGSIGIFCSQHVGKIIGVESVAEAIADAKENAKLNNLQNTHFFAGDVIKVCNSEFFETHGKPDVVITDPPRAGMHQTLVDKLLEIEAPKIVYVSCNPATQARDIALLSLKYNVVKVQAVDMFPHTHHVESVALLMLKTE
jgi:23S rRNA (uracil1939-C5)-methyltransferase